MDNHDERTHAPSDNPITEKEGDTTYSNVLRVKADPPGTTDEERKKRMKSLAGAIAHGLRRFGEVHVRAIGKEATYKAVKAIIDASGFVAVHGHDLYTRPGYIMAGDVTGKDEMTGISFLVVSSTSSSKRPQQQD
jgi:stage V sporulation protein SpoVS